VPGFAGTGKYTTVCKYVKKIKETGFADSNC
jgi:hypothetical protein